MNILKIILLSCFAMTGFANENPCCCQGKGQGGIMYSDSSSGRFICWNGETSHCYSTRHAVMEMQKFKGCCMWQGGVKKINPKGQYICRNGDISEICTLSRPHETVAVF